MKTLISNLVVNGVTTDAIIDFYKNPVKDEDGDPIMTNEEKNLCKCVGSVWYVDLLVFEKEGKIRQINLTPGTIKILYEKIIEIEATETEDEFDV